MDESKQKYVAKEARVKKRKGRKKKEKKGTSDLGSSNKMGRVVGVSSLCLDCKKRKRKREQKIRF